MARFVFKLEGVLKQREYAEQERQRDLAEKQAVFARLEQELRRLDELAKSSNEDLRRHHLTGPLDMTMLAAHRRFIASTTMSAKSVINKMAIAQRAVEESQKKLVEATKQRKIIEKLREKQQERWKLEQDRKEQAAMDEVGMQIAYEQVAADYLAEQLALGGEQ